MKSKSHVQELRDRARKQISDGALTLDYQLNPEEAIGMLNEALATELVCVLRYRFHYFMASGIHSTAAAAEFLEHSNQEQQHADMIASRIKQLGGKPEMNPAVISQLSHSEYKEGATLVEMLKENLIAERIAIESYREMIDYFGDRDPTTRRMLEDILAVEEDHADELADLLFAMAPDGASPRRLYFSDEIPAKADAQPNVGDTPSAAKAAAGQRKGGK
jgi:bacterioferritin